MHDAARGNAALSAPPAVRRRPQIVLLVVLLLVAAATLLVFIGLLGDFRRQGNALTQAKQQAAVYAGRSAGTGILPLNLEPEVGTESGAETISVEWLSAEEARLLRKSGSRVIVARTAPVVRALGRDGRAVVFFKDGRFDVEWVTLAEFEALRAAQQVEIARCARRQ